MSSDFMFFLRAVTDKSQPVETVFYMFYILNVPIGPSNFIIRFKLNEFQLFINLVF